MADIVKKNIIQEKETSFEKDSEKKLAPIVKDTTSKEFKLMRAISNKYPQIEGEIFQALSKAEAEFSEDTLTALLFSAGQKLYNDSYATGRAKGKDLLNIGRALTEGDKVIIELSFSEMEEYGYGIKAGKHKHRDELKTLIEYLHRTPLFSLDSEGSGKGKYLMNIEEWSIEKYGAKAVKLRLDKTFSNRLEGYGRYPQDIMRRLVAAAGKEITSMDRRLLLILGQQDKNKPHFEPVLDLMRKLGKKDEYKKNPKRATASLFKVLDRFKAVGIISAWYPKEEGIVFYFKKEQPLIEGDSEAE